VTDQLLTDSTIHVGLSHIIIQDWYINVLSIILVLMYDCKQ